MLEPLILVAFVALFAFGYGTRSSMGVLVPGAAFAWAVIVYQQSTPTDDEISVLPAIYVLASGVGVLLYVAGAALGRRSRRPTEKQH